MRAVGIEPVRNPGSMDGLAGLLLSGGSDVNPKHYGQQRLRQSESPDDLRDELEMRLLRQALVAELPVLAICRGLQLFNVFHGGTLIQHLPSTPLHRQKVKNAERGKHPAAHRVQVSGGTRLAELVGAGDHAVNSRHHQAVDRVAPGLIVSATAEDGVVEALELPGLLFAVAVQWHPEDRVGVSEMDRLLFEGFALAAATSPVVRRAAQRSS